MPRALIQAVAGLALAVSAPMQGHCTIWLRYRIAVFRAGKETAKEAGMCTKDQHAQLEPTDPTTVSYALLRHLGLMLDELSAQGLIIWQDEGLRWHWAWATTSLQAEQGFWAIGEAVVDAVVTRFPVAFDTTGSLK